MAKPVTFTTAPKFQAAKPKALKDPFRVSKSFRQKHNLPKRNQTGGGS